MKTSVTDKNISVQITKIFGRVRISAPKLVKLVKGICRLFDIKRATVSVTIVNNAKIRELNRDYLGQNHITDCLSFDLSDSQNHSHRLKERKSHRTAFEGSRLFDLVVNGEQAVKEATRRGHTAEAELALYITHGMLHNLGFDDSTQAKAKKMHRAEDEILQRFGYGIVYDSDHGSNR